MSKTYYDSELTGAQIEDALEAIHGVITPSNNGKVLYIDNGQIKAASASRWGHGAVLEPLNVTANGDYTPPTGTDGFDEVHVAVPSATLTTKSITQNGTYNASQDNADGYSSVAVNVSGGGSAVVQPLSVTQNGTYNPPSGVDGYAPVTVNVSGGGGDDWANLKNYLESSGTQYINTEYIAQNGDKFEIIAEIPNVQVDYACLFGRRQSTTSKQIYILTKLSSSYVICGQYASSSSHKFMAETVYASGGNNAANDSRTIADTYNKKIRIVLDGNHFEIHDVNGLLWYSPIATPGDVELNLPMYLFAMNTNGSIDLKCKCKIYLYRVYDINNNIKLEMIATQNNSIACMQDTVSGDYFYNAGTGDFVYGTDA